MTATLAVPALVLPYSPWIAPGPSPRPASYGRRTPEYHFELLLVEHLEATRPTALIRRQRTLGLAGKCDILVRDEGYVEVIECKVPLFGRAALRQLAAYVTALRETEPPSVRVIGTGAAFSFSDRFDAPDWFRRWQVGMADA